MVRDDDPTNNVPDSIFSKLGMQLHRRDKHPIGIIKNAIYDYFESNYAKKFETFEDLSPIVTTKQVSVPSPYSKLAFFNWKHHEDRRVSVSRKVFSVRD